MQIPIIVTHSSATITLARCRQYRLLFCCKTTIGIYGTRSRTPEPNHKEQAQERGGNRNNNRTVAAKPVRNEMIFTAAQESAENIEYNMMMMLLKYALLLLASGWG